MTRPNASDEGTMRDDGNEPPLTSTDRLPEGHWLDVQLNKPQRWAAVHLATMAMLAPFGTPAGATRPLLLLRRGLNRHGRQLVHLLGHHGIRRAVLHAEQGSGFSEIEY